MLTKEHILADLNPQQRAAVIYTGGPLLVMAGPGSGKTRIIVRRAAWFVAVHDVEPERVLAVTFTNRAAAEMRTRLHGLLGAQADAMWIYTFHALALRLLRLFGAAIGLPDDFAVAAEDHQRDVLLEAYRRHRVSTEQYPLHMLADFIARRKAYLLDPTQPVAEETAPPLWLTIAQTYQSLLREQSLLDFDDLIERAVYLLRRRKDVRENVRKMFSAVLVDEYQDINLAQYTLLSLIATPSSEVTVVADEDQSIYGWRGAEPRLVDRFRREYAPHVVKLVHSYRSTEHILYAAQRFIARQRVREEQSFLRTHREPGEPIYHYIFQTLDQEQRWLAYVIRGLVERYGYAYRDIAILYRVHTLADPIEQYLLQEHIPVQRVQPRDIFERDAVQEVVRYLALLHVPTTYDLVHALNFPVTLIDEPTQAFLQRVAREEGVTLGEIAQHPEHFPEIGPLTRWQLRRFRDALAALREDARTLSLEEVVERLFDFLERRRSPFTPEEHESIRRLQREPLPGPGMDTLTTLVRQHTRVRVTLSSRAEDSLDAWAAYRILEEVFIGILGFSRAVREGGDVLHIVVEPEGIRVGTLRFDKRLSCSLSLLAWRLSTDLLVSLEPVTDRTYVVYDLETTGVDIRRDEIVEIAALRYRRGKPEGEGFHTLVRPTSHTFIPRSATLVHGITWSDVANAPVLSDVLPDVVAYLDDDILVGHNIRRFDNRFLDRAMGLLLDRGLSNPVVDTLEMAQRLLPNERQYTLEHLIRRLGLQEVQTHRALDDVHHTAALYHWLLEENARVRARESLPAFLPLVAVGILDAAIPLSDVARAMLRGAGRVLRRDGTLPEVDAWLDALPSHLQWLAMDLTARLREMPLPLDRSDAHWEEWRHRFQEHVTQYLQGGGAPRVGDFLDYEALRTALDERDPDTNAVTLMTLHNAKGTEFSVVFIIGLEDGHLPLWTARGDREALNEERRVFYVGMTRARDRLYLTSVLDRRDGLKRVVSPFAFELAPHHVRRFQVDRRGRVGELKEE